MTRYELMQWRHAYLASEHRWAVRGELYDDGILRLYPIFIRDVEHFAQQVWDGDYSPPWTMEPDP